MQELLKESEKKNDDFEYLLSVKDEDIQNLQHKLEKSSEQFSH